MAQKFYQPYRPRRDKVYDESHNQPIGGTDGLKAASAKKAAADAYSAQKNIDDVLADNESFLKNLEKGADADAVASHSRSAQAEKAGVDKQLGGSDTNFFKDDSKATGGKRFSGRITKRKAAAGGLAGLFGGGLIAMIMGASGPLAFVHMSNLMEDFHTQNNSNMADGRLTRILRYFRGSSFRNAMGPLGNRLADKYDARLRADGINPDYGRGTRVDAFEFDTSNPKAAKALAELKAKGYNFSELPGGKFRVEAPRGFRSGPATRGLADDIRIARGESGIVSAVQGRMAGTRYKGGRHPLQNFVRNAIEETIDAYRRSVQQANDERVRTGDISAERPIPSRTPEEIEAEKAENARRRGGDVAGDGKASTIKTNVKRAVAATAGFAGILELACGLQDIGDSVQDIRQTEVVEPLMRTGLDGLALGSQIATGQDVNAEEMGALFERFFGDTEIGKLSAFSADSIKAEMGEKQIGERTNAEGEKIKPADLPTSSKPGRDKPAFFKGLDEIMNTFPAAEGAGCGVLQTCLPGDFFCVGDVIDLVAAGYSGGTSSVVASGIVNAVFAAGGFLASDFIDSFVNWLAGSALQCASGPQWGNCVNIGARLAANDEALSVGGRELTEQEELTLDAERKRLREEDNKTKSLYARYLDPTNTHSLLTTFALQNPDVFSPQPEVSNVAHIPLNAVSSIFGSVGNLFSGKAKALSVEYDYGFPEFGFSFEEQVDEKYEDPFENAEIVKNNLEELNDEYGECFGTTITVADDGTPSIEAGDAVDYSELPGKCDDNDEELIRYRFFLSDTIALKGQACYEGIDEGACSELGFESNTPADNVGSLPSGNAQELAQQILDSGRITGDGRYIAQIQAVAGGDNSCNINPTILGLLLALSEEYTIYITSLNRFCTGVLTASGTASYHYREGGGHAVDIGIVNGQSSTGATPNDVALIQDALPLMPSGSGVGQSNCRSTPLTLPSGIREFSDSCNHIHLEVPVQ